MHSKFLGFLFIVLSIAVQSTTTWGFIAPDSIRDCRILRLINQHDRNRARIAKDKATTDNEKSIALQKENRWFTDAMVEVQHLQQRGE